MALSINDVHSRLDYLIKKNKWGHTSPADKDLSLDMAQLDLFNFYYGDPNQYQAGRPIPPVAHGQNQKLHDALSPFLKELTLTAAFTAFPADYIHLDSAFIYDNGTPVNYTPLELVSSDKVASRANSQLLPITIFKNAFIAILPSSGVNGITMFPETIDSGYTAQAYYLSRPASPYWAYTQSGRAMTWNEGASIDLSWSDDDIQKIIQIAIQYIGENLENNNLIQFGQLKEKS